MDPYTTTSYLLHQSAIFLKSRPTCNLDAFELVERDLNQCKMFCTLPKNETAKGHLI